MLTKFDYLTFRMFPHFIKTVQNATDRHVTPEACKSPILLVNPNGAVWAAPGRSSANPTIFHPTTPPSLIAWTPAPTTRHGPMKLAYHHACHVICQIVVRLKVN